MDVKDLIPGADNLFKYLLSAGIILLLFALIYPLKKEQELKIERIELLIKEKNIKNDIKHLRIKESELKKLEGETQDQVDKLKAERDKANKSMYLEYEKERIALKNFFDDKKNEGLKLAYEIDKNLVELSGATKKVNEMHDQIWSYFYFRIGFITIGILFCVGGFRFWIGSTYRDELTRSKDVDESYRSSYIRFLDYTKRRYIISSIITIAILLIVYCIISKTTPKL